MLRRHALTLLSAALLSICNPAAAQLQPSPPSSMTAPLPIPVLDALRTAAIPEDAVSVLVLRGDRGRGHLVVGSTAVVAVSVVGDVFYLLSKGPDLKAMVGFSGDLGSHVGLLAYAISGRGRYPMPGTVDSKVGDSLG